MKNHLTLKFFPFCFVAPKLIPPASMSGRRKSPFDPESKDGGKNLQAKDEGNKGAEGMKTQAFLLTAEGKFLQEMIYSGSVSRGRSWGPNS